MTTEGSAARRAHTNQITASVLTALRSERLDLASRLEGQFRAHGAPAGMTTELVHRIQTPLRERMSEVHEWDVREQISSSGATPDDLTLANASSWAVWEPSNTLLPLDPQGFAGPRRLATETHADVHADDVRWNQLLPQLHSDVVFISLNWGGTKAGTTPTPQSYRFGSDFLNFHENVPKPGMRSTLQSKFRRFIEPFTDQDGPETVCATSLHGGYMTDLYKGIPTTTQDTLRQALPRGARRVIADAMLDLLAEELRMLTADVRPVLACIGRAVEHPVRERFTPLGYQVLYLPHYSGAANHVPMSERRTAFQALDRAVAGEAPPRPDAC